jgi:tetratricopeptide (TPR) repeat protein
VTPPLRGLAAAALVFALACAVYWPQRTHEFLNYDDDLYVTRNAEVQRGLDAVSLRSAFTSVQGANWFPLTRLSWMLDRELQGERAEGFLLTNLLLHALASALLLLALARLTGGLAAPLAVAALFAVHPVHVESVAWVSARKDVLSGVFFMLALLGHAHAAEAPRARGPRAALFASTALGLLAKPVLVTLPCVLLLLDAWPLGRLSRPGRPGAIDPGRLRQAVAEKLPLFALAAVASAATIFAQSRGGTVAPLARLGLGERVGNALVAYVVYLRKLFWPSDLAIFYPHAALPLWKPLLAAAFLLALTVAALRAWPRRGHLLVGWLWFLGVLVPTIGLLQVGSQALADRYLYLPTAGIAIALVWSAAGLAGARGRRAAAVAAFAAVAALAVVTRAQLRHWHDSVALFEHALAVTDDNFVAHAQLGAAFEEQGRLADTIRHYREAVRIRPGYRTAANNLAWLLATSSDPGLRNPAEAVSLAERAVALSEQPDPAVLDTLAVAYAAAGRFADAARTGELALEHTGEPGLQAELRERLALYRAGRAYPD